MGACGPQGGIGRGRGELGAAGGRASDLLTGTLSAAPGNGRAKMGTTILGAPLEAPGRGKGELKQSPRYEYTKTAPNVAYGAHGAHKGAQGRTRAHGAPKRHCTATQTRGGRAGTTNNP